jgi:hypothetical protein
MEEDSLGLDAEEKRVRDYGGEKPAGEHKWMAVDVDGSFVELNDLTAGVIVDRKMAGKEFTSYKAAFIGIEGKTVHEDGRFDIQPELPVIPLDRTQEMSDIEIE